MSRKITGLFLIFALCSSLVLAEKTTKSVVKTVSEDKKVAKEINPIALSNQMMIVFMERMKAGNLKEARDVAKGMVDGASKYVSNDKVEFKSFASIVEKTLYELLQKRAGNKATVRWIEQPVSDGFYFLAMLDFQEGKHKSALENIQKSIYWNPARSSAYAERGFMLLKQKIGADRFMSQIAYLKALELASNPEDFAAALQGLAFIKIDRQQLDVALACLLVEKEFVPDSVDAEQEIAFIKRHAPNLLSQIDLAKAKEILKKNNIQATYSPIHIEVLVKISNEFAKKDKKKAVALLKMANKMAPSNKNILQKLKQLGQ